MLCFYSPAESYFTPAEEYFPQLDPFLFGESVSVRRAQSDSNIFKGFQMMLVDRPWSMVHRLLRVVDVRC